MARFKLTHLEVLEFALEGIQNTIGLNSGNPDWTVDDWQYHYKAEKELQRRIKIMKIQSQRHDQTN